MVFFIRINLYYEWVFFIYIFIYIYMFLFFMFFIKYYFFYMYYEIGFKVRVRKIWFDYFYLCFFLGKRWGKYKILISKKEKIVKVV